MPRVSKAPVYYPSKKGWFANIQGRSYPLAKGPKRATERAAKEKYNLIVTNLNAQQDGDKGPCWAVLNAWLVWNETRVSPPPLAPNTLKIYERFAQSFTDMNGDVPVQDLRPSHVNDWLKLNSSLSNGKKAWNEGNRRLAVTTIKSAFRWAKDSARLITTDPFSGDAGLRQKKVAYRSDRLAITDEEYKNILEMAMSRTHRDFGYLLMFLYETGARPSELYLARGSEWDENLRAFVIRPVPENVGRYKLARYNVNRVVYVPNHLVSLLEVQREKYGDGVLFRTEQGEPFFTGSVAGRFADAHRLLNGKGKEFRKGLSAYSFRHAFVTRWVKKGGNLKVLADLLGTSVTIIERCYCHLFEDHGTLRNALEAAQSAGG